ATPGGERLLHSVKFPLRDTGGRRFVASITMDVTEQSRSEAQLQFVTDTMSAAVIRCDAFTRILWVNRVYCHWMKRDTSDIVGRPLVEVIGERAMEEIRPHIDAVLSGERPSYERLADFPGLGRRWVAATYTPTFGNSAEPNGWISVVYDIHERRETQEQLGILLDALPMAVLRVNRDETYEWVNAIYAQWLGMPARDIVGRRLDQVMSPDQLRALRPHIERVLAGEQVPYERLAHLRGLGERWVRGVFTPIRDSRGRVSSWVVITADVQEEKRLERALREADRRKDEFIATLAHELRNPLAPIRNAVGLLAANGGTGADAQWGRAVIERQVDQMSRLIDDLLDIARISSGKLLLRRQRVALKEVLDIAMETSQPHIESARHRLAVRQEAGEITVDADPTRLAQVFSNLLNNAAKYTPPGGSIGLDVTRQGAEAIVCVTDNGMGFPPSLAAVIFEPFSQWAGPEHARAGLGLGLALVRAIVQLHGGSVTAASLGEGRGSRFEVRLPIAGAAAQPAAAPGKPEKRAPRLRVMVADDNRDAADSLSRLLALYGHEVRVAYDGLSAIELAREFSPLVAVLDIGMPGVNGYDVARRLREQHGRSLKLIALTGWGQQADRKQAADAGFDHHVTKPIDPRVLNEMICEL
ncbi:MAG TPA: PAS domain-containing protein, partial [Burkholderiales bacterium]